MIIGFIRFKRNSGKVVQWITKIKCISKSNNLNYVGDYMGHLKYKYSFVIAMIPMNHNIAL